MPQVLTDINSLIETMITDMQANQPTLKTVEIYNGQFSSIDTGRFSFKVPAVFIVPEGGAPSGHPDSRVLEIDWQFSAFIVATGDKDKKKHSSEALNLTQAVATLIKNNRWTTAGTRKAQLTNLGWVDSLDKVTIWSIRWTQPLLLACE